MLFLYRKRIFYLNSNDPMLFQSYILCAYNYRNSYSVHRVSIEDGMNERLQKANC